jgi:predicted esterase
MSALVLFFGGWQASVLDMKAWTASAIQQNPGVMFDAYPYPVGASAKGEEAVAKFTDFTKATNKIQASKADTIYIVGHSSGCAIANAVDARLKDHTKTILVALDGYCPSAVQLARPGTQVWVAESSTGKSLHYQDLQDSVKDYDRKNKDWVWVNIYKAPADCSTKLSLHFSLVNLSSSDDLVKFIPDGYKNCKANLSYLNP